ncbi:ribonuclease E/G [Proteiniclasticum ruminis]|uniref:Ribonuclease G n=1 Tax=Proteiniclasticum ruminis TaxID=398199 RepID=A0A1G8NG33_9CLOT|nr:ribonuclease E/G [Proteiniclasticum ruminis]SDI79204.1 ribonuclease G [Proteiniclasticum ruminis]
MIELFIEDDAHRRIALKERGSLTEFYIEDTGQNIQPGDLYLGIIKKKVKSLKSVFVDIGAKKNAYLYVQDFQRFQDYKEGQSVLVEVLKEEEGSKGTKVTDKISIGGKYVVLFPGKGLGFSKKLNRDLFLDTHGSFAAIEGYRILFREASMDASRKDIEEEISQITRSFEDVYKKSETGAGPLKLYGQSSVLSRILRDNFSKIQMIYVNSRSLQSELEDQYGIPSLLHKSERSLFDFYGIENELSNLRNRKVYLKDGGNIVIEETEAMVVVDVNSAKHKGSQSKEDFVMEVNLQAAGEIARQIRLRNLSGIILIDFIDVKNDAQKSLLKEAVEKAFQEDPLFGKCYPITDLGLLQLTRKKKGSPIYSYLEEFCTFCKGAGTRLSFSYVMMRIKNELASKTEQIDIKDFHIQLHKHYEETVRDDIDLFIQKIESGQKRIYLEFKDFHQDYEVQPLVFKNQIQEMEKYLIS